MRDFRFQPIHVAGIHSRCAIAGDRLAPPTVLLASGLVRAEVYRATVEELACHYRVYLVELPGSGRAARLAKPWSLADYAKWVAAFIDNFGLREATVIGHSHSGNAALLVPALYTGCAGRVVIVSGCGSGPRFRCGVPYSVPSPTQLPSNMRLWHANGRVLFTPL